MKIRWTEESVRLRITPSELENLLAGEKVRTEFRLGVGRWSAAIAPTESATDLSLTGGDLTLHLARTDLERLASPSEEGVYFRYEGPPSVRYYIEKDFPCAHPRAGEAAEASTETFAPCPETKG